MIYKNSSLIRNLSIKMSKKMRYPAADRNKPFILEVLQKHFDSKKQGKVLELASGTGQQVSFYAGHFPNLIFQPSDIDTSSVFDSIKEFAKDTPTNNVKQPIKVDVSKDVSTWQLDENEFDYIICVNLLHVSPFICSLQLFKGANYLLKEGGLLVTYGPYAYKGSITPQSNVDFDRSIRNQNPEWGLRDIVDLEKIAQENGIKLIKLYDLPANNKCLVWEKEKLN